MNVPEITGKNATQTRADDSWLMRNYSLDGGLKTPWSFVVTH